MYRQSKKIGRYPALYLIAVSAVSLCGCLEVLPHDEHAWAKKVEAASARDLYAPHIDISGRFFNPWNRDPRDNINPWRWMMSKDSLGHLDDDDFPTPVVANTGDYLSKPGLPSSIAYLGHATFVIDLGEEVVVTDPFFSKRAVVLKRRVDPAFGADKIPDGAIVVISHNHYDHLDRQSVAALGSRVRYLCPLGLGEYLKKLGAEEVRELDWWESVEIQGIRFTSLPIQHWSRRIGQKFNQTLWCSWLIEHKDKKIYFGGDSGYFKGFREFGRRYPKIDVALLPIGSYMPRWFMHYAHMNIDEALKAFEDLGAQTMIPTQWGVLDLADEPAAWPAVELQEALATTHKRLRQKVKILRVGGRLMLD